MAPIRTSTSDTDSAPDDDGRAPHFRPDVLLLRFEHTDCTTLNREIDNLCKIFKAKECEVKLVVIPMKDSWEFIRPQVLEFLQVYHQRQARNKIIVISGHGGWSAETGLSFCSHNLPNKVSTLRSDVRTLLELHASAQKQNFLTSIYKKKLDRIKRRYQPPAEFSWINLKGLIQNAQCHVLVFLDCCNAGGAAFSGVEEKVAPACKKYAKSVIYACHWNATTSGELSQALCEVVDHWEPNTERLSACTIVDKIRHTLGRQMLERQRKARQDKHSGATQQREDSEEEDMPSQPGIFDLHGQRDDGSKEQFILTDKPLARLKSNPPCTRPGPP